MLKVSTVSPTFKKDYKYDVENYRQLSHPTTASKSLERRIYVDPYKHFEPTLISPQFGFRKRLSCNFQLLVPSRLFINHWRKISKSNWYKQTTRKLSTELVDHGLLLRKLHEYRFSGKLLILLKSCLTNRQQRVRDNGHYSDYVNVISGVPQGFIFSSLLSLI